MTGGITAATFTKAISVGRAAPGAIDRVADDLIALADHEGFPAHAEAIRKRIERDG